MIFTLTRTQQPCTVKSALAGILSYKLDDFTATKFYGPHALTDSNWCMIWIM